MFNCEKRIQKFHVSCVFSQVHLHIKENETVLVSKMLLVSLLVRGHCLHDRMNSQPRLRGDLSKK